MRRVHGLALIGVVSLVMLAASACSPARADASKYDARVATEWARVYLVLVEETPGFTPPVASRAFGYAGVTLYESIVHGMPQHQSLAGQLNGLDALPEPEPGKQYHWPTVANSAMAAITRLLFPNALLGGRQAMSFTESRFASEFRKSVDAEVYGRSVAYGAAVAQAIYEWSLTDGGKDGYRRNFPPYDPPIGPGLWEPTPRRPLRGLVEAPLPALQPYWGQNRPFVLSSGGECDPGPPPPYSEEPGSQFYNEAWEVYVTVKDLTPDQHEIALFWADDPGKTSTPPGHSISILTHVIEQKGYSLGVAAEAYARVGIAVADAFIACWWTKYEYDLLRPITYIQNVIDPTWATPVVTDPVETPPFPEYTSGHSVQSAAAAQVMTDMFGDVAFTDRTHDSRGFKPRTFDSFWEAAQEAAISRLYGGIHYRTAIERGIEQGKCIGQRVSSLQWRKVS